MDIIVFLAYNLILPYGDDGGEVNLAPNPSGTFNVQSSMNKHSDNANFMWPKWTWPLIILLKELTLMEIFMNVLLLDNINQNIGICLACCRRNVLYRSPILWSIRSVVYLI
ncbi:hypothetical protein KSP40_PGU003496 [Platanthera guangdongensis]|uniref:Uncharacterized protein n=1 Tax=Platanthera guangdongensis TaxID=2320717 RepID=A0ABR2M7Y1_9ASPA